MIIFNGNQETIIPEPEANSDVMLFSFLPGLSRAATRPIAPTPFARENGSNGEGRLLSEQDKAYYRRRADAEMDLARAAPSEGAARAHYLLAGYYLDMVHHEAAVEES